MIVAGKLASEVLDMIGEHVVPGIKTVELDVICHNYITKIQDAIPAPLNYRGFPSSTCISVNNVVCHGIPSDKILKKGDIVNIDVTVIKDGYHGDTSKMFFVGKTSIKAKKLCKVTQECLYQGIRTIKPGALFSDIGDAIEPIAKNNNYSIVRAYCGHGIGLGFHEAPQVYHHINNNSNFTMEQGMVFTIEPMINIGSLEVNLSKFDGWTVTTKDRTLSAQWEHTILVTDTGYKVLTLRDEERGNI